jgi:hypothetical protein
MKDAKLSYDHDWQKLHWRSLESSYRRSAFFEFYEDSFYPFYHDKKFEYLFDFNESILQLVFKLLKLKPNYTLSHSYISVYPDADDYRKIISPKESSDLDKSFMPKEYFQVFDTRHNFIPNLSIVDLLFNQGNKALDFI